MIDWPEFKFVEVLPNLPETFAERNRRRQKEFGMYVRRQYGLGIPRSRGSDSALMRLSGDCSGGGAFKSRSINCRSGVRQDLVTAEVVKKLFAKPEAPGTPRVEVPKEAPSVTAGGETGEVCAVSSTRLNSVADETVTPECTVETPPVAKQASVDLSEVGNPEEESSTCETEDDHWFGSELPQYDTSGDSEDLLVGTAEDDLKTCIIEDETNQIVEESSTCDTERVAQILWFETSGASEDLLVGTSAEDLKSSIDDDVGNLGEDRFDSTPEGSGQKVINEAQYRIVATKLSTECLLWVKDLIRDSLEWMITAVDWFVGRGQFGFIDNFGGFRK